MPHYAHSRPDRPREEWHVLEDHLTSTAKLAEAFAAAFDSGEWAHLAGLWHDLGKYQPEFQQRLCGGKSVEHSGAGAAHAICQHGNGALPVAFVIAGHHTGLANLISSGSGPKPLRERLQENVALSQQLAGVAPTTILNRPLPPMPSFLAASSHPDYKKRIELWIRFLFSALTDADYLDTERDLDPDRAARRSPPIDCGELLPLIEAAISKKSVGAAGSRLQDARTMVVNACRNAAALPPGLFSLTAPTGSGKTLASMLFALHHAQANGLRRVIVVLPYTSIIEQNADVFREAFGDEAVIEHHSNLDPEEEATRLGEELTARHKLASENWDAPVIVTTTVQLFESLFANRTSRCRKLHNIAQSVIILDEVQSLPPGFLPTILDGLKQLAGHYGCTILLSTATPPALVERSAFRIGLPKVTEIIPDPDELARSLKRVRYRWPESAEPLSWDALAEQIARHHQALAVVHLRRDARTLVAKLVELRSDQHVHHLSATMCPKHRTHALNRVREALAQGEPCVLVSTQLIEAGVDIDFPVLFRALAGLDSIVQAAGRCNREGRLAAGEVHIFEALSAPPKGVLSHGLEVIRTLRAAHGEALDPDSPHCSQEYFRAFYAITARDANGIEAEREQLNFSNVASTFRLIEDDCVASIVVPYDGVEERLGKLNDPGYPTRKAMRALQPYVVRVYPQIHARLLKDGAIREVMPDSGLYQLLPPFHHLYDVRCGLLVDGDAVANPTGLIV